jgi:trans-aconitate 2-methyltransferase
MANWDPELYLKFRDERTQPSVDLIARIELEDPRSIIDLGCGPGNSTVLLARRWPWADLTGLDNSPQMIERARVEFPNFKWLLADAGSFMPERRWDLVFSNAAIQWIDHHEKLLPQLFALVNSGGALAVQVPANNDSPLHQSLLAAAAREPWRAHVASCARLLTYLPARFYFDLLSPLARRLDVWETVYYHALPSHQALIEWYRGTGMRPFVERLGNDNERALFEAEVLKGCLAQYPLSTNGKVLYPFKRLFFVAYQQ